MGSVAKPLLEYHVRGAEGGANYHGSGVNAGVDEGASADLSVQVVTGKKKGVSTLECRRRRAGVGSRWDATRRCVGAGDC